MVRTQARASYQGYEPTPESATKPHRKIMATSTTGQQGKDQMQEATAMEPRDLQLSETESPGRGNPKEDGVNQGTETVRMNLEDKFSSPEVSQREVANDDDGFTVVGTGKGTNLGFHYSDRVNARKNVIGIRLQREGPRGETEWNPDDIWNLMRIIQDLDSKALFLNCKAAWESILTVNKDDKKLFKLHWRERVDHRTEPWGPPRSKKERTHIIFYVATDILSKGLKEIREHTKGQAFLTHGGCIMQSTRLSESISKAVEILLDINPLHVQRESMAARMEAHLQKYHKSNKRIPVNIVVMPITGIGMSTRACMVVVGSRDEKMVAKILRDHPFPYLDTMPY